MHDSATIHGHITATINDPDGAEKHRSEHTNIVTATGAQWYASRALGSTAPAVAGMKLGTGTTTPAVSGAGAALATYLTNSHQALSQAAAAAAGVVTFTATWEAGKATTASPVTEIVLVTDTLADATSTAANTLARALLAGIPAKAAADTLTITWTHTLAGA